MLVSLSTFFFLFFFFLPKTEFSKYLREGHYNLFGVTGLKHIALDLIYCTWNSFDIKLLLENITYCPRVCVCVCVSVCARH